MHVEGKSLCLANGEKFLMRGTNIAYAWFKERSFDDIKKSAEYGSNASRIVISININPNWNSGPEDSATLEKLILTCKENGQIAILEIHDSTGFNEAKYIEAAVEYWISQKEILNKYKDCCIVNIANEWSKQWESENPIYAQTYIDAVKKIRAAKIQNVIMIDAPGYGQDLLGLAKVAPKILAADESGNIIFSGHMYCYAAPDEAGIKERIDAFLDKNLCFCVGEFAWKHNRLDKTQNKEIVTPIPYKTIFDYCNEKQVGWLAWSWFGNGQENDLPANELDLVKENNSPTPVWGNDVFAEMKKSSKKAF